MYNEFEYDLIDDVVSRATQSRVSYTSQAEEFRSLNADLQTYLDDLKTIDDDNRQLQESIEQFRTNYIQALENHLKILPNDFHQESVLLTNGHIERYKLKCCTRRFLSEREEFKRRINFLSIDEKEQIKRLNALQKKERAVRNEFIKLNQQIQNYEINLEKEKQSHQQAMNILDDLRIQLEQKCVERSNTEFEIQTLKEEIQLLQRAKEFLDEEREIILSAEVEANEYLLSRLSETIDSIREDFSQLNTSQLNDIENEYKQLLQTVEENLLSNQTIDGKPTSNESKNQHLEEDYENVLQELTILNSDNKKLSRTVFSMESELHSLRQERMQNLVSKDNEIEHSTIELQSLNEKLNYLAEYDRNLKFELRLYRGVLESEHRRKEQQKQSKISNINLRRPTTLSSHTNAMTDRTARLTTNINQSKFNEQPEKKTVKTSEKDQSHIDSLETNTNIQIYETLSTTDKSNSEILASRRSLSQQVIETSNQERDRMTVTGMLQCSVKPVNSISTAIVTGDRIKLPLQIQQSIPLPFSESAKTQKSSASSSSSILQDDQLSFTPFTQFSATPSDLHSFPRSQETSPTGTNQVLFEACQIPSAFTHVTQILSEGQQAISTPTAVTARASYEFQVFPTLLTMTGAEGDQAVVENVLETQMISEQDQQTVLEIPIPTSHRSSEVLRIITFDNQNLPVLSTIQTIIGSPKLETQEPSSELITSSFHIETMSPSTTQESTEHENEASTPYKAPLTITIEDEQLLSTSDNFSKIPSDVHSLIYAPTTPIAKEEQHDTGLYTLSSTHLEEQGVFSIITQETSMLPSDIEKSIDTVVSQATIEHQYPVSTTQNISSTDSEKYEQTLPISEETPLIQPDIQESLLSSTNLLHEDDASIFDLHHSSSPTVIAEMVESSSDQKLSSVISEKDEQKLPTTETVPEISSDVQTSTSFLETQTITEHQDLVSTIREVEVNLPIEHEEPLSSSEQIPLIQSDIPKSPTSTTTVVAEHEETACDLHELSSMRSEEYEPLSSIVTSTLLSTAETIIEPKKTGTEIEELPSTDFEESQQFLHTSSEVVIIPTGDESLSTLPVMEELSKHDEELSEIQKSSTLDSSVGEIDIQEEIITLTMDSYQAILSATNQSNKSLVEEDNKLREDESTSNIIHESTIDVIEHKTDDQLIHSIVPQPIKTDEVSSNTEDIVSESLHYVITIIERNERQQSLSDSPITITVDDNNKLLLQHDKPIEQVQQEEEISSSFTLETQEDDTLLLVTMTTSTTHHIDDQKDESDDLLAQTTSKSTSVNLPPIDTEEVDKSTSQRVETTSDDEDDSDLATIMQELRSVFDELANGGDLVEIDDDLPAKLLDRLEFRDYIIRTLFESLIQKYLVQSVVQANRPSTLDWTEFRDIIFPIITGRYLERHIRKLFDLFDTSKDGHLSVQEIAQLLEILQAKNTLNLAQNIINEYDSNHDGKLSVDELIEAIKRTDNINENVLSESTENKEWFNLNTTENQSLSFEVPILHYPTRANEKLVEAISLLAKIFKNIGADSDSKLLDSTKKNLSTELTNEFMNNDVNISIDDLQSFVELFLNQKQMTDRFINWIEFRNIFLPIINNGYYSTHDIRRWFNLFDLHHDGFLPQYTLMQLLRLLQIENIGEIFTKLNEIRGTDIDDVTPWTIDELNFVLDNLDETSAHRHMDNERINSFDINWISENIF